MFSCIFCHLDPELILKNYEHFALILDPYPLCDGHLMVVSKSHYGCIGELPDNYFSELSFIASHVETFFQLKFGSYIAYEHGRSGACHQGGFSSCDHMHLHLLPLSVNLHSKLNSQFFNADISQFEQLRRYFHGRGEYLFFKNAQGTGKYYSTAESTVPSHFIRTLIAEEIKQPELASWSSSFAKKLTVKNIGLFI